MIKPSHIFKARRAPEGQWAGLIYHDGTGVDRDLETLLGLLRERHGFTLEEANTELVRRLSFAS